MSNYCVFFVSCGSKDEAGRIARALVRERLAACVSIVPGIESFYWWKNEVESSRELLLVIKSTKNISPKIFARVRALHSYDVPEIIQLPIEAGSSDYLRWIDESLARE